MKNADRPASCFQEVTGMIGGAPTGYKNHKGLTKREHFAAMAMQGLLSNGAMIDGTDYSQIDWAVKSSVKIADALLAELEK